MAAGLVIPTPEQTTVVPLYSVRMLHPGGRIEEIGGTTNGAQAVSWALKHHDVNNKRGWVLNVAKKKIVLELAPKASAPIRRRKMAGGAA